MIGQTLSHFKITAKLGEGGMGEVYRAEDSQLGREVAIKVLPEAFTADPERLARFEREARVLASLNHPNIAGIHQVEEANGLRLLVMELVEGEDLAEVLARGPVSVDDTLQIALQIAEALESAHEKGIVHRDLKPANIKITPDRQAKVLDFGLAKALEAPGGADSASLSISPTLTAAVTSAGVLLGTAPYMSPEQAKGMESDRRADVWAFGVVVWEMLTGMRLFAGDSVSDTLAAVLRDEIDAGELPAETPPPLQALLARCLDRDPKSRLRDIGEARVALSVLTGGHQTSTLVGAPAAAPAESEASSGRGKLGWIVAAAMTLVALFAGSLALRTSDDRQPMIHSNLVAPDGTGFDVGIGLALSPDGTRLAFAALDSEGRRALWVRSLDSGQTIRLSGTEGGTYPFWSPDSRNLGFTSQGSLKRVAAAGGATQTLAPVRDARGGAWGPDGTIVYAPDYRGGLWKVPAVGGEAVPLTALDEERGEQAHRFPVFLPDSNGILLLTQTAEGGSSVDASRIELLDPATGERSGIVTTNSSMAYSSTGHLLFWRQGSLMVVGFDAATGATAGDPVPIAEGVGYTGNEFATFSISQTGLLAYQSGSLYESFTSIGLRDASGEQLVEGTDSAYHQDVDLSGDGSRVAYRGGDNSTIWVRDLRRQTNTRFTFQEGDHFDPTWSPDDEWIAYATNRSGTFQIYRKPASGMGSEELLFDSSLQLKLLDWSPDGRTLLLDVLDNSLDTDTDIGLLDLETGEVEIVAQSPFQDGFGTFSPDGRWLAYSSADAGEFEVYVIPVSGVGGRFQISTSGGDHPQWHPSGTKLYYVNPLVELMVVDFTETAGGGVQIGLPERLFNIRHQYNEVGPFQVMPDGETFLTVELEQEIRGGHLTLVQNWLDKLERD